MWRPELVATPTPPRDRSVHVLIPKGSRAHMQAVVVYTYPMEVGVRELRGRLSDYLERVRDGQEVVVTERGVAVARIVPIVGGRALDKAVADGLVLPPPQPARTRPKRRTPSRDSVSDLVAEQRR